EPKQKTRLVLVDAMDGANGMASPMPYSRMIIFLTHPLGGPGPLSRYDDWLRLVITHEYAHVLHLDMVAGIPKTLQSIFGRMYFPNLFQPKWMIEGLATYEETEQTSGGRGRSAAAEMVLRMAAVEGPFPRLDQATTFPDSWPAGQTPYLFGQSFTRYIADRYGREKLAEISVAYSGRGVPFLVTSTGERVLRKNYKHLWHEWQTSLRNHYRKEMDKISTERVTASTPRTKRGFYNIYPAFSRDGSRIAYSVSNGDEFPGIYVMNADGSGERKVVENVFSLGSSGASVAWGPDNERLYYTKLEIRRNSSYYNDIYYYDLAKKREVRLTKGLRARDPYPSPDGKRLVFVVNKMGMTRLAVLDVPRTGRRAIQEDGITYLSGESPNQYGTPRFSPDGSRIAVSLWKPGGVVSLQVLDRQGNKRAELFADRSYDDAPAWSPDGKYLYFSSDRTGVFNLYAYELATKKLFQVTNVTGGAFTPSPSPDGKTLAFSSYGARGYDIHTIAANPAAWKSAKPYRDPYPAARYEEKAIETSMRPYSPLSTIYPRFWIPWFGYSHDSGFMVGGITFNQDAVQRHTYYLTGLYGPKDGRVWYGFDYFYDGLFPTLRLHASDIDNIHSNLLENAVQDTKNYEEKQKTLSGSIIVPLLRTSRQHFLTLGYRWRELEQLTDTTGYSIVIDTVSYPPAEGILASGWVSYLFNSARRYSFSISPEQGRTIQLGYERLDTSLGSDFDLHKYTADWIEYIGLPGDHHVLQVRAFVGTSSGDLIPQRTFQLGGDSLGDMTVSIDQQTVHLRGYPVNEFRGSRIALGSLEYRFPIMNIERGWNTKPLFFRRLHGALFVEAGNAWDGDFDRSALKWSVGAEARLDMEFAYYVPITLRLVIAAGLDEEGETIPYIGFWMPVLF
ncbi:MAG TPA: hypothetical protein DCO77_08995, partial [Nitrospiraceae bacterium]|nr:hypothetical protein [Nitrospiraceae bacterium]